MNHTEQVKLVKRKRKQRSAPFDVADQAKGDVPVTKTLQATEHQEQCSFVNWFRVAHRGVRILAIPNGGNRNVVTAMRLRNEGVSAGVPDLFVPAWGLWIEMKRTKGGSVKSQQKDWMDYLESIGQTVLVCRGARAAREAVGEFVKVTARNVGGRK